MAHSKKWGKLFLDQCQNLVDVYRKHLAGVISAKVSNPCNRWLGYPKTRFFFAEFTYS